MGQEGLQRRYDVSWEAGRRIGARVGSVRWRGAGFVRGTRFEERVKGPCCREDGSGVCGGETTSGREVRCAEKCSV